MLDLKFCYLKKSHHFIWAKQHYLYSRANPSELGILNTHRPHTVGIKTKTDIVLNDETSEIERSVCVWFHM